MSTDQPSTSSPSQQALTHAVGTLEGTPRAGQTRMVDAVTQAIDSDHHLLVQAGTGTGKSLGYLVPTMVHTAHSGQRVVISTATLALQRQILTKDAPLAADAVLAVTGIRPTVAVLKGWHNYLCRHRLAGGYPDDDADSLFSASAATRSAQIGEATEGSLGEQVVRLRDWARHTDTGDRDDLVPGVSDRAWAQVSVSKAECVGTGCPLYEDCYAVRARQGAGAADVVVTNHAMLGIAVAGNSGVLPDHEVLVVDEAHDLVDRVRAQGTVSVSAAAVARVATVARTHASVIASDLESAGQALQLVLADLPDGRLADGIPPTLRDVLIGVEDAARSMLTDIRQASSAGQSVGQSTSGRGQRSPTRARIHFRSENLNGTTTSGKTGDTAVSGEVGGSPDADAAAALALARTAVADLLDVVSRMLSDSVAQRRDVAWIERPRVGADPPRLTIAPIDVARSVAETLFQDRTAILTSATLSVGGGFEAMAHATGLTVASSPWEGLDVGTPFDYARQGIVYTPTFLPAPSTGISEQALEELCALTQAAGGGMLGLFSSRRAAQDAAEYLRAHTDITIYAQGDDQLPTLVDAFTREVDSCLVGTLSLWQGVDVPGRACRLVVIDRIPFPRPDDPVAQARCDAVEARGGNGFMSVSATHAALLLAQGAGRLIRRQDDRGVVAILDRRVRTARYGSFLTRSLPQLWPTSQREVVLGALQRLAREQ